MAGESSNLVLTGPDLSRIEDGDTAAMRDAVWLLWQLQSQTKQLLERMAQTKSPVMEQDWLSLAMSLKGRQDTGFVSSHRVLTHSVRVYRSTNQVIATGTDTKVQFDTVTLDNYIEYDTTNFRIIPKVEGIWIFFYTASLQELTGRLDVQLQKNGSIVAQTRFYGGTSDVGGGVTDIVSMNGSSDYIEGFVRHTHGSNRNVEGGTANTFMIASHLGLAG